MLNFDKSHAKSLKTLTYQKDYYRPGQFTALSGAKYSVFYNILAELKK